MNLSYRKAQTASPRKRFAGWTTGSSQRHKIASNLQISSSWFEQEEPLSFSGRDSALPLGWLLVRASHTANSTSVTACCSFMSYQRGARDTFRLHLGRSVESHGLEAILREHGRRGNTFWKGRMFAQMKVSIAASPIGSPTQDSEHAVGCKEQTVTQLCTRRL